mgnify:CR=1 FL=1
MLLTCKYTCGQGGFQAIFYWWRMALDVISASRVPMKCALSIVAIPKYGWEGCFP